jgi:hypothetical protein
MAYSYLSAGESLLGLGSQPHVVDPVGEFRPWHGAYAEANARYKNIPFLL